MLGVNHAISGKGISDTNPYYEPTPGIGTKSRRNLLYNWLFTCIYAPQKFVVLANKEFQMYMDFIYA